MTAETNEKQEINGKKRKKQPENGCFFVKIKLRHGGAQDSAQFIHVPFETSVI